VSEELDREVNNPEKACKISAIIELTGLTLLGTVVIFEDVPWQRSSLPGIRPLGCPNPL
jgi:hypothetical protein